MEVMARIVAMFIVLFPHLSDNSRAKPKNHPEQDRFSHFGRNSFIQGGKKTFQWIKV